MIILIHITITGSLVDAKLFLNVHFWIYNVFVEQIPKYINNFF